MILAIDPSGNFDNGKGKSGYAAAEMGSIVNVEILEAKNFTTKKEYYNAHLKLIEFYNPRVLIIENFILYGHSAKVLTNQELETPELIGYIMNYADKENIRVVRQNANLIKGNLSKKPDMLKQIIKGIDYKKSKSGNVLWSFRGRRINNHMMDAIRHIAYFVTSNGNS